MKNQNRSSKGFSLVELIVVIAIMAILVGILAPSLMKQIDKSRLSKDKQTLDTCLSAITTAMADPDAYEAFSESTHTGTLTALLSKSDSFATEVKSNLKGKTGADITFGSKNYKGCDGDDVCVSYDENENCILTLTKGSNTITLGN